MTRILTSLIPIVLACGCQRPAEPATPSEGAACVEPAAPPTPAPPVPPPPLSDAAKSLAASNAEFAIDLYHHLRGKPGNIVVSPYSVSAALAMTFDGARGETAEQMARVLRFPDRQALHPAFSNLSHNLAAKSDGFEMTVANALWPNVGFETRLEFQDNMAKFYRTVTKPLDYKHDMPGARKTINEWTSLHTRGKIKELIGPKDLDPDFTVLVLTNAIYSAGQWASAFPPDKTKPGEFHCSANRKVPVKMMHQDDGKFFYMHTEEFELLEMPYRGGRVSFLVLLPTDKMTLADIEAALTPRFLDRALAELKPSGIPVAFPQLKLKYRAELQSALKAMGMPRAFENADFSGIASGPLCINKVIHEATLDADEKGVVAAAATAVEIVADSAPIWFTADRPFLFLIRDRVSGSILFIGRVVDPSKE